MKYLLSSLFTLLLSTSTWANNGFSIYLVRHAEKQAGQDDPKLSACGQLRAQQLATLLAKTKLQAIYSTSYQRSMATATPTARQQQLPVKNYAATGLRQLALMLQQRQQNALVVGHSNTTPELVQLLSHQRVDALGEQDYQALYQVNFNGDEVTLVQLQQPLTCPL